MDGNDQRLKSDYTRVTDALAARDFVEVASLGQIYSNKEDGMVRFELWANCNLPTSGLVIAHSKRNRKIGIYAYVGAHGAPVENDLAWIESRFPLNPDPQPPTPDPGDEGAI